MWVATRHEGFDRSKGALTSSYEYRVAGTILDKCSRGFLRSAMTVKVASLLVLMLVHYGYGGLGFFSWDLSASTEEMRSISKYRAIFAFASTAYFIGSIYLTAFQCALSDDAAHARGYRAGSKLLSYGCFFDIVSAAMQMAWAFNFYLNYNDNYWAYFNSGSMDWIFSAGSRAIQGIALILIGGSFFLLEVYHDEGTNDWHGPVNAVLFTAAGGFELAVLLFATPMMSSLVSLAALMSGMFWSLGFEDECNAVSPALNESELCNELEREITDFTQMNPMEI